MKLSLALLAAASPALVSGRRLKKTLISADSDMSNVEIKAESKTGSRLLSKARRLGGVDEGRGLQDQDEMTWITGYSIKFHS